MLTADRKRRRPVSGDDLVCARARARSKWRAGTPGFSATRPPAPPHQPDPPHWVPQLLLSLCRRLHASRRPTPGGQVSGHCWWGLIRLARLYAGGGGSRRSSPRLPQKSRLFMHGRWGGGRGGDGARGRKHTCKRSAGSLCDLPTSARSPLLRYRGDRTYRPPPPSVRARQRGLSPDHSRRQHTLWLLSESGTDPREGWGGALPQPGPPSTLQLSTSKSKGTIAGPATAVHTRPWLSRMHLPSSLSTPPPHPLSPLPSPPPPTLAISFDHWRGAARAGEAVGTLFGEQRSCEVEAIPARGWLSHLLRLQPHVERDRRPFFPPPLAGAHTNPPHHDVPRQCPPYPGHPAHHAVTTLRTPPTPPPCTGESSRRGWWRRRGWWLACGERQRGSSLLALLATRLNPLLPLPPQPPPPQPPPFSPAALRLRSPAPWAASGAGCGWRRRQLSSRPWRRRHWG